MTGRPKDNQSHHHLPSHMMCTAEPPASYAAKSKSHYIMIVQMIFTLRWRRWLGVLLFAFPSAATAVTNAPDMRAVWSFMMPQLCWLLRPTIYDGDSPLWPANSKPTVLDVAECRCWLLVLCCLVLSRLFELWTLTALVSWLCSNNFEFADFPLLIWLGFCWTHSWESHLGELVRVDKHFLSK